MSSMLYVKPETTVMVIVPVATVQVGWVKVTEGAAMFGHGQTFVTKASDTEKQPPMAFRLVPTVNVGSGVTEGSYKTAYKM